MPHGIKRVGEVPVTIEDLRRVVAEEMRSSFEEHYTIAYLASDSDRIELSS